MYVFPLNPFRVYSPDSRALVFSFFVPCAFVVSLLRAHKKAPRKAHVPGGQRTRKPFRERLDAITLAPGRMLEDVSGLWHQGVYRSGCVASVPRVTAARAGWRMKLPFHPGSTQPRGSCVRLREVTKIFFASVTTV